VPVLLFKHQNKVVLVENSTVEFHMGKAWLLKNLPHLIVQHF